MVVIFSLVDVVHQFLHSLPVFCHYFGIAKLLPHHPRHYHTGIRPSETHHRLRFGAILCQWCHAGKCAGSTLRVAHIAHPLMKKRTRIGKECTCLGEHLRVGCPSQALIALRAVGGHREVVRQLSPIGVHNQSIDRFVAGGDCTGLELLRNRCNGYRLNALDCDIATYRNRYQPIAEKCASGLICYRRLACCKGVFEFHSGVGDAQILAMDAALRTIHTSILGSVAIVEQFRNFTQERSAFGCGKLKCGHTGAVLSKVHHKVLAGANHNILIGSKLSLYHHLTIFFIARSFHFLPYIGLDRRKCQIGAQIYLCSGCRQYLARKFGVYFGCCELFGCIISGFLASVIHFSIENRCMLHRSGYSCLPRQCIGTQQLLCAVVVGQFEHSAKGALLSYHSFVPCRGDYLVGPPSGRNLCRELILCPCFGGDCGCHIVGIRPLGLLIMGKSGFQHFVAYQPAVHI